jgi:hypothetical protein
VYYDLTSIARINTNFAATLNLGKTLCCEDVIILALVSGSKF